MSKKEYQKQYRLDNKEKLAEYGKIYQREYYQKHPERYIYWRVKKRARDLKVPFDLDKEDIVIPSHCPILGIPLVRNVGQHGSHGPSPSVDRIDPTGGYTKDNIQIISQRANVMKNDASIEELRRFAQWVLKQ